MADKDVGDKKYVMDVMLKKEYSKGYMGNFVTGAGTSKRYVMKGILMQMSERSQLAAIGNVNNLNQKDQGIDLRYAKNSDNEIIVQCKHYKNSKFSNLIKSLKEEVNKIQKLNPSRYIVVTSLACS